MGYNSQPQSTKGVIATSHEVCKISERLAMKFSCCFDSLHGIGQQLLKNTVIKKNGLKLTDIMTFDINFRKNVIGYAV